MQEYANFSELAAHNAEGIDYLIHIAVRNPDIVILAVHGGKLEPGTSELAKELAEQLQATSYCFISLKEGWDLHLTSARFDEPRCVRLVERAAVTVSIHCAKGYELYTYVGGVDQQLLDRIHERLVENGFNVKIPPERLNGNHPRNIVNRNKRGRGVQLEITEGQIRELLKNKEQFYIYCNILARTIYTYVKRTR
ncbi:poly-gamma-glutamate hydrolase family protein [Bacillus sp. 165]|uniref:poly-gamma-glutamate hydrolase family protein n=1 Tax=Bacillus sp. 165 TaxID=1529117 RepID=UPI001ADD472A|nr:poly-gamma-glutamate hydrolase family protein [Bacillus sp. 165]MBO9128916.1 poly-gamma-glutamate hydrolase family protein [Bacillus sp. 165]